MRVTGRVNVKVNGKTMLTKVGSTKLNGVGLSGAPAYERKTVMSDQGIAGFVETPIEATCEMTITDRDDISLDTLARIYDNGTVIVETAGGGKVYTLNNATCKMNMGITTGEGETSATFIGRAWTESTEAVS